MFRQLSFDTSTSDVHVALFQDQDCVAARVVSVKVDSAATARQEAAALLMPSIDEIMRENSWSRRQLDCVTAGTGPGSFTGIRTGVVTARAISQALRLPLYPVSLLESLCANLNDDFAVAMFSNAGHYFAAKRRRGGDDLEVSYANLVDLQQLAASVSVVYADERTKTDLQAGGPTNGSSHGSELRALPLLDNIAVVQGRLAFNKLSKLSGICEKLMGSDGNSPSRYDLRLELANLYPYNNVTPTYLRAPSVTLKKANV